jgi:hypothetical protein
MFAIGPESGASSANVGDRDAHIARRKAQKGSQVLIRIIRVLFIVNRRRPEGTRAAKRTQNLKAKTRQF